MPPPAAPDGGGCGRRGVVRHLGLEPGGVPAPGRGGGHRRAAGRPPRRWAAQGGGAAVHRAAAAGRHRDAGPLRLRRRQDHAVRGQAVVDRLDRRRLPHRRRRHRPAAAGAVAAAQLPLRGLFHADPAGAPQPQGVPGAAAGARDRHERHLRRARPDPVLRLLGARAHPDVLHDRRVGRAPARLRLGQVHPLHADRLGDHAAGLPGPVVQERAGRRRPPSASASPSRCRCGRCTPGSPMPTPRRRRSARCCWPGSC